jgi:hypothetical protein
VIYRPGLVSSRAPGSAELIVRNMLAARGSAQAIRNVTVDLEVPQLGAFDADGKYYKTATRR